MDAFLNQGGRRPWSRWTQYLLGVLLVATFSTQMLLPLPWPVSVTLAGVALWLLWSPLKRLGRYLWWVLMGLGMLGIVSAEPAARAEFFVGTLLALLVVLIVRRFLGNIRALHSALCGAA